MSKIIITNQHVGNRGDESATIGEITSLRSHFGKDTEIVMYLQSDATNRFLPEDYNVFEKSMLLQMSILIELVLWIAFKLIRIDIRRICSSKLRDFIEDHETANIVISSCGGPYIGDIYINHEFIHILHLALPILLKKKTAFYAVSMGPFQNKFMNFFRKKLLKNVGIISLRDKISFNYVKHLLPEQDNIFLTTDACLADQLNIENPKRTKNLIGMTPLDYNYPNMEDVLDQKREYKTNIVKTLNEKMVKNPKLRIKFFPQLFDTHSDVPFIEEIINLLEFPERTYIFSDQLSGREQQKEISSLEYMIANRYHSAIFACKTHTPVVCIVYEHKAQAFMESVNLGNYCIDIYDLDYKKLLEKLSQVEENEYKLRIELRLKMDKLQKLSQKTAELIFDYFNKNQL